jgi:hypothetical protein
MQGLRMRQQQVYTVANEIGRRLMPRIQQKDAVMQQLGARQILFPQQAAQKIVSGGIAPPFGNEIPQIVGELTDRAITRRTLLLGYPSLERTEYGE